MVVPGCQAFVSSRVKAKVEVLVNVSLVILVFLVAALLFVLSALVTPTVKRALSDAATDLRNTNHTLPSLLAPARPDPLTTNELVNELRPVSRLRPQIQIEVKKIFSFLFRVASPLAHANCAIAAHASLSQV